MKGIRVWLTLGVLAMTAGPTLPHASPMTLQTPAGPMPGKPPSFTATGLASWYSVDDPGIQPLTASGEPFDDTQLTCAAWNLPFHATLHVTNLETGREVVVRVNDRGPARRLVAEGRVIDLSKEAFRQIASLDRGLIPVKVELLASE